jgi:hypothetical protein
MLIATLVLAYIKAIIWPAFMLLICFLFKSEITGILYRLRHAKILGTEIDLSQDVKDTKELSIKIKEIPVKDNQKKAPTFPLTEANARMIHFGLRPSPSGLDMTYYLKLAEQDPTIALAGLRIEFEIITRNLAKGFNIQISERESVSSLLRKLYNNGAITDIQMQLATKVLQVCNAVVHGMQISYTEATAIIDSATVLAKQYYEWLDWGFKDVNEPP